MTRQERRAAGKSAQLREKMGLILLRRDFDPIGAAKDRQAVIPDMMRLFDGRHAVGILSALAEVQGRIIAFLSDGDRTLDEGVAIACKGVASTAKDDFTTLKRMAEEDGR